MLTSNMNDGIWIFSFFKLVGFLKKLVLKAVDWVASLGGGRGGDLTLIYIKLTGGWFCEFPPKSQFSNWNRCSHSKATGVYVHPTLWMSHLPICP